jgi:uncharacterized DUF497 family protein
LIFDWDDANRSHISRHNISPHETEEVLLNDPVDLLVQYDDVDGEKLQQVGETNTGRILVVISVLRGIKMRVATAWDASKSQKDLYLRQKAKDIWHQQ